MDRHDLVGPSNANIHNSLEKMSGQDVSFPRLDPQVGGGNCHKIGTLLEG